MICEVRNLAAAESEANARLLASAPELLDGWRRESTRGAELDRRQSELNEENVGLIEKVRKLEEELADLRGRLEFRSMTYGTNDSTIRNRVARTDDFDQEC